MTYRASSRPLPRRLAFARAWLGNPRRVGAVAPSGRPLAKTITREIGPESGPVLELGPGTGVFTEALLRRGVPEAALTLVEAAPDLAATLRERFPTAQVVAADAARLDPALAPPGGYGAIVSGLPILAIRDTDVRRILALAFAMLRPGGGFYQFTYGPRCPVKEALLAELGLGWRRIGTAWRNLPPATVYRIGRAAER
jgi:phospholipid N-methyltransferase